MTGKIAIVDYHTCDPSACDEGVCPAVAACPRRLISQEAPYEPPMTDPAPCRGCGDCTLACPLKAIKVLTG